MTKRLAWIVNHRTLLQAEVPIFRGLGYEVFIPKIIPDHDPDYRSGAVTYDFDACLSLSAGEIAALNVHNFYEAPWSSAVTSILNRDFDTVISSFSFYTMPVSELARHFCGRIVARIFGREHPRTYAVLAAASAGPQLLDELKGVGNRFVNAQGYHNLSEVEPPVLRDHATTVAVPLPDSIYRVNDTWTGLGAAAVFVCPGIRISGGYYRDIYDAIQRDFGDLPHLIFGRQVEAIADPNILAYLSVANLLEL